MTEYPGHATEMTREYAEENQPVRLYSCGGDGTFHEIVQAAAGQSHLSVGCIPCGSGNDFVRNFGHRSRFLDMEDQMLGQEVRDPDHVEGTQERMPGLGLLPVRTVMSGEKVTRRRRFTLTGDGSNTVCEGYEIHMGHTEPTGQCVEHLAVLDDGTEEGCVRGNVAGTYLHGILDNPSAVDRLLRPFAGASAGTFDYRAFRQQQYDLLAGHVRSCVDMDLFYQILRSHD